MALSPEQRSRLISGLESVIGQLDHAYLGVGDLITTCIQAFANAKAELTDITHFYFKPAFKTRVISVPRAKEGIENLWDEIRNGLIAKFKEIEDAVNEVKRAIRGGGSLHEPGERGLQTALNVLADVHTFLVRLGDLIKKVLEFIDIIDDIKKRIETLDDLFLPNTNPKSTVDVHYRKRETP